LYSNDGQFCLFSENNFELGIISTNRFKKREVKYSSSQNIESVLNLGEKIQVIFYKANSLKNDFSFGVYDFSTCNNPIYINIDSNSMYYFDKKIMMINDTVNKTFTFSNFDELKKNDFSVAKKNQLKNISEDSLINIIFKTKDIRYFEASLITSLYKNELINFSKKNQLCSNSKYLCTQETPNTLSVINNIEGRELSKINLENNIESFFLSKNGNRIITNDINGKSIIWNPNNGEELFSLTENNNLIGARGYFSPMDNFIVLESQEDSESDDITLKFFDFRTGKYLYKIDGSNWMLKEAFFSYDDKYLVLTSWDNSIYIWDLLNKRLHFQINEHKLRVNNISFTSDSRYMFSSGLDNQIFLWELKSGLKLLQRIELENNNWLVKLPNSPYYMCSKDASKMLHYVTPSLKVIGFEQLDPVYNRPDIVLDSIGKYFGGADQELVANYRQSWEKRIERLGLDKEKLGKGEIAVPSAEIIGADEIAYESKDGKLEINVSANDSKYPLRRFNVYVNEVPLYGSTGISIAHLKKQVWDTTVSVPLSVGDNKIQVSVMNELGLENFKYPTYVNYTPKEEVVSKTYFIGIGVNEFKDATHNLTFCEQDVRDLASAFSGKHTETTLLTNEQVTKEKILSLKELLQKTTVNDKVIISCSSHGLLDDSLNFYLATYDVDFEHPKSRGLRYEELEGLLDGIPARQKLLLLDACNSGENDKLEAGNQVLAQNQATADSTKIGRGAKAKYASTDNQKFIQMNELFVNVRNNTGSVIISAAGGQQSALEGEAVKVDGKAIQNGAFTFSILECLEQNKGKELKVNALKQYAEKRVEEITNGKQKPTSRQETMEIDWDVR
jgi:WD40 repeat protein